MSLINNFSCSQPILILKKKNKIVSSSATASGLLLNQIFKGQIKADN